MCLWRLVLLILFLPLADDIKIYSWLLTAIITAVSFPSFEKKLFSPLPEHLVKVSGPVARFSQQWWYRYSTCKIFHITNFHLWDHFSKTLHTAINQNLFAFVFLFWLSTKIPWIMLIQVYALHYTLHQPVSIPQWWRMTEQHSSTTECFLPCLLYHLGLTAGLLLWEE